METMFNSPTQTQRQNAQGHEKNKPALCYSAYAGPSATGLISLKHRDGEHTSREPSYTVTVMVHQQQGCCSENHLQANLECHELITWP